MSDTFSRRSHFAPVAIRPCEQRTPEHNGCTAKKNEVTQDRERCLHMLLQRGLTLDAAEEGAGLTPYVAGVLVHQAEKSAACLRDRLAAHYARLTAGQIRQIKEFSREGQTTAAISREMDVSERAIKQVIAGELDYRIVTGQSNRMRKDAP